jgi:hypothetical protein
LESVDSASEEGLGEANDALKALRSAATTEARDSPSPPPLPQPESFAQFARKPGSEPESRTAAPAAEDVREEDASGLSEDGHQPRFRSGEERRGGTKPGGENHYASVAVRPTPGHPLPNANPNASSQPQPRIGNLSQEDPVGRDATALPNSPQSRSVVDLKSLFFLPPILE